MDPERRSELDRAAKRQSASAIARGAGPAADHRRRDRPGAHGSAASVEAKPGLSIKLEQLRAFYGAPNRSRASTWSSAPTR